MTRDAKWIVGTGVAVIASVGGSAVAVLAVMVTLVGGVRDDVRDLRGELLSFRHEVNARLDSFETRLRNVVVDRQRVLYPYVEPGIEYAPQAVGGEVHPGCVADSLRCHGAEASADELQLRVRLERAGFHGTVVLDPAQAVAADGDAGRCGSHDGASIVARKTCPARCATSRPPASRRWRPAPT